MTHIFKIITEPILPADRISPIDLGESRKAGPYIVPMHLLIRIPGKIPHPEGPGTDNTHIALQNIEELREFIKTRGPKLLPETGEALIIRKQISFLVPRV